MKFEKYDLAEGMKIPIAAMQLSGFGAHESAEYYTMKDTVVVLKTKMNALEMIRAAWSLHKLSAMLSSHLALHCFADEDCETCSKDGETCPYEALDFALDMDIPDELRELAGIPADAPVHVELLDDGEFTVSVNHDGPGLWDVPAAFMKGFLAAGICPAALEKLLKGGEIVYGE